MSAGTENSITPKCSNGCPLCGAEPHWSYTWATGFESLKPYWQIHCKCGLKLRSEVSNEDLMGRWSRLRASEAAP